MARLRLLLIGGLVLAGLAVWGLRAPENELPDLHADLVRAAERVGIGGSFELSEVADFHWDRAHVFAPYNEALVEQELGFAWSPLPPAYQPLFGSMYLQNEGLILIVFVEGEDDVTGWSALGTRFLEQPYLEMTRDGSPLVISRTDDELSVGLPPFGPAEDAYLIVPSED